jgi:hypothetical protein
MHFDEEKTLMTNKRGEMEGYKKLEIKKHLRLA